ncbi:hypothetical protein Z517_09374 [Fonsecaea pedrosoi CBS 271.37]|uniref:Unplaced genomic scaffold supercont1.6, whole genome shotgun sequence n=1 Tax=Fonsecaea pedrosoi CBS 271.37 TaxID=1442368 RepID=A0A0D2GE62_9EURO|nr:uncharacterized protein Z517_09374 [Fonsecaea pedrosoi CBS 271.37]KIW76930.1 hypothetical protein Z517_09374 [Fonsecaea pedrosoi CBS 271.37]
MSYCCAMSQQLDIFQVVGGPVKSLDHVQDFVATVFREEPTGAAGDKIAAGQQDQGEDDLESQRESPGELGSRIRKDESESAVERERENAIARMREGECGRVRERVSDEAVHSCGEDAEPLTIGDSNCEKTTESR